MTSSRDRVMKDSGVDWIGRIPESWQVGKFRHLYTESKEVNGKNPVGEMLSVSGYRGVELKEYSSDSLKRDQEDLETYRVVRPGQLAVNTMWLNYAGLGVSELIGHVSPAYRSYWIDEKLNPRFAHHLMRSQIYVNAYTGYLTGVRPNSLQMSRENLMNWPILLPEMSEQQAIAEFLDRETAQIDELIAKQNLLIETLEERRASLILSTVTRGLSPEVSMQPTGQYWAPECPANWTVERLSRHFGAAKGSNAALLSREYCSTIPGEYPVYSGQTSNDGVMAEIDSWEFDRGSKGTLLTTTVGSGQVMKMRRIFGKFSLSQNCMIIDPKTDFDLDYFKYQLEANFDATRGEQSSHMQTSFRMSDLYGKKIFIPAPSEQSEIAQYLNSEIAHIVLLTTKAEEMVELLTERRQALISSAVTGKIDVRGK